MGTVYTGSTVVKTDPDRVFEFLRVPENQTRWGTKFVRSTKPLGDGRYEMETPLGRMVYRVDAEPVRRIVDFVFETPGGESILPARVVPHARGAIVTFTITRAPGTSDEDWDRGMVNLDEELIELKRLVEVAG